MLSRWLGLRLSRSFALPGGGNIGIPVCGAGIGDMQPRGGRGAITLVECCGGESQIISYTSSLLIVVEIRTDAD